MRLATAYTIKNNYPENIHIVAEEQNGKWMVSVYLLRNKQLHSLLLSTKPVFDFKAAAIGHANEVCGSIVNDKSLKS